MDTSSVRYSLADVVAGCRNERSMYRADQPAASPLCVELFKRAFAGDSEAWAEVRTVFERHMRAWIGIQRVIEPEDAIQEAFLSFYRSAPHQPSLVATDDLSRVLSYLRGCVKTAILMLLRKQRFATAPFDTLPDLEAPGDFSQTAELRAILLDRVRALLQTAEEQIVFQLYFLREMKPQEIQVSDPDRFSDVAAVNTVVQRLTRRMRKDTTLQDLRADIVAPRRKPDLAASLEIRDREDEGDRTAMDSQCTLEVSVLLEYITGRATPEARAAVDRSPSCRQAAEQLAREVLPLLRALYRADCPRAEMLVAYQEGHLNGLDQLMIRQHVLACSACQSDYALLAAVDRVPLAPAPGPLRRLIEAALMPAPRLALRGEVHWYQALDIAVTLSERQRSGQPRTWNLRGEARTVEGLQAVGTLVAATLRSLDEPETPEHIGEVDPSGSFVFRALLAGTYQLSLLTNDLEIVIPHIRIGEDA